MFHNAAKTVVMKSIQLGNLLPQRRYCPILHTNCPFSNTSFSKGIYNPLPAKGLVNGILIDKLDITIKL